MSAKLATPKFSTQSSSHTRYKRHIFKLDQASGDIGLIGIKGVNLRKLIDMKMPIPPGLIVSTLTCKDYKQHSSERPLITEQLSHQMQKLLPEIESITFKKFGSVGLNKLPLLLALRVSPIQRISLRESTVLSLGINDKVVEVMAAVSNNPRWAYDTYRRFIQNFGTMVLNVDKQKYEEIIQRARERAGVDKDSLLDVDALKRIVEEFKEVALFTQDPWQQLTSAIEHLFLKSICTLSTENHGFVAVIVQAMVYGDLNNRSGSGVLMSRNPVSGQNECCGDYLPQNQRSNLLNGDQVVPSIRTMREKHRDTFQCLKQYVRQIETFTDEVQSLSFVVENDQLYVLGYEKAILSARASVHIAVSMVVEERISDKEALLQLDCRQLGSFFHNVMEHKDDDDESSDSDKWIVDRGRGVCSGVAMGRLAFTIVEMLRFSAHGENVIFCENTISMDTVPSVKGTSGVILRSGGITSTTANYFRNIGTPCVVALTDFVHDTQRNELRNVDGAVVLRSGDIVSLNGSVGTVFAGYVPTVRSEPDQYLTTVLRWADLLNTCKIRAVADNASDVCRAKKLGAQGIGVLTTEYFYRGLECRALLRQYLHTATLALNCSSKLQKQLVQLQKEQFMHVFRHMENKIVKIRLLSASVQSVLCPDYHHDSSHEGRRLNVSVVGVQRFCEEEGKIDEQERMHITDENTLSLDNLNIEEVSEAQIKAIAGAILDAKKEGISVKPSILIPNVLNEYQLSERIGFITDICQTVCKKADYPFKFLNLKIGALIDTPIACLRAEQIMRTTGCDFVCFDTDRLTELLFGFTRSESMRHSECQHSKHITTKLQKPEDPFTELDIPTVGALLHLAVKKCKHAKTDAVINVVGSHCSDKNSLRFLSHIGVDSVCCDPYLVPIAKIAAAQGKILDDKEREGVGEDIQYNSFWKMLNTDGKH